jgi:RES domain-containing protein
VADPPRVPTADPKAFAGLVYRHQGPRHDPRSGEGARINGGRYNPPDSFPVLYLCLTRACAVAELTRLGRRHVVGLEGLLPRHLYGYDVEVTRVLDLTDAATRAHVAVSEPELVGEGWAATQALGTAAHDSGFQAVLAPSATGVDQVLALFPELAPASLVDVRLIEVWSQPSAVRP